MGTSNRDVTAVFSFGYSLQWDSLGSSVVHSQSGEQLRPCESRLGDTAGRLRDNLVDESSDMLLYTGNILI